jgi:hypothetical protein
MTVEEMVSLLTGVEIGLFFSAISAILITAYYKLRERMARLEAWVEYRKPSKHEKGERRPVPKEV